MAFLKTLLIILLVYYGVKFLAKLLAPYLMRYVTKKAGQKFEQAFGGNNMHQTATPQKEGKVTIDKVPSQSRKNNGKVGDYVDFEEVD